MPSFDDETIEEWRRRRVRQTPKEALDAIDRGANPALILKTIDEDLAEERQRLERARNQIVESEHNIACLRAKRERVELLI